MDRFVGPPAGSTSGSGTGSNPNPSSPSTSETSSSSTVTSRQFQPHQREHMHHREHFGESPVTPPISPSKSKSQSQSNSNSTSQSYSTNTATAISGHSSPSGQTSSNPQFQPLHHRHISLGSESYSSAPSAPNSTASTPTRSNSRLSKSGSKPKAKSTSTSRSRWISWLDLKSSPRPPEYEPVGHRRTLSKEETSSDFGLSAAADNRKKKRSLSNTLMAAGSEMKRRLSGAGGVRRSWDGEGEGEDLGEKISGAGGGGRARRGSMVVGAGKAVGLRVKGIQKGDWPFVLVFICCLFIFFSALAGIGYVPPPDEPSNSAIATFQLGVPVYDPLDHVHGQQIMAARRKMEEMWERKKRPKDGQADPQGAWMKPLRDDGARRKKQNEPTIDAETDSVPEAGDKIEEEDDRPGESAAAAGEVAADVVVQAVI